MAGTTELPPEVLNLCPREREVATIVYAHGAPTAKDVVAMLSVELSNGAVRSMLVRLVAKGIIKRAWGARGRGNQFIYMPALTPQKVKQRALQVVADQFFDGSLLSVARAVFDLLEQPEDAGRRWRTAYPVTGSKERTGVDLAA